MSPSSPISCLVCSGPSNGICHFGVQCCRACASFFHRSSKEARKYTCRRGQSCRISNDEGLRNSCRACRLKKCLEIGMADEKKRDRRPNPPADQPSPSPDMASSSFPSSLSSSSSSPLRNSPNILHFADSIRQYNHALRALSTVEGINTGLSGGQKARLISHDEYARMVKGSALLVHSMLCQHLPQLRELPKENTVKLLRLFHTQFLLIHQANLTERANIDADCSLAMLVPGGLMDKARLDEHFFAERMDAKQRQRLSSIIDWHFDFCRKKYRPLAIGQLEFAAIAAILFWNTAEKAVPLALPLEQLISSRKEALYGELFLVIGEQIGNGQGQAAAVRLGKIFDLISQLTLHTWEVEEMFTMAKIFLDLPDFWDEINLPSG